MRAIETPARRAPRGLALLLLSLVTALVGCREADPRIDEIQRTQREILAQLTALESKLDRAQPARRAAEDYSKVYPIPLGEAPLRGDPEAPVTLVVYSDFQCPYCARILPQIDQLLERHPGKVRLAFKHFPLSFHQAARPLAAASMAAQAQGRFWELHDAVFARQKELTGQDDQLLELARGAGLDVGRFRRDLESKRDEYEARIGADVREGRSVDVRGTPTLFINGRKVRDRSVAGMSALVEAALEGVEPSRGRGPSPVGG